MTLTFTRRNTRRNGYNFYRLLLAGGNVTFRPVPNGKLPSVFRNEPRTLGCPWSYRVAFFVALIPGPKTAIVLMAEPVLCSQSRWDRVPFLENP